MSKIFGVGFHKTGTTSLGRAMTILGYKNCFGAIDIRKQLGDHKMMQHLFAQNYDPIFKFVEDYDAFNDNPWHLLYRELDEKYPNSQFILTIREEKDWLESAIRYFGNTGSPFRLWIYGKPTPIGNEDIYLKRYRKHNKAVKAYFKGSANFLVLDLNEQHKWEKICRFLNKPVPNVPYPYLNSTVKK